MRKGGIWKKGVIPVNDRRAKNLNRDFQTLSIASTKASSYLTYQIRCIEKKNLDFDLMTSAQLFRTLFISKPTNRQ